MRSVRTPAAVLEAGREDRDAVERGDLGHPVGRRVPDVVTYAGVRKAFNGIGQGGGVRRRTLERLARLKLEVLGPPWGGL